jgi:hypothetical protein
MTSEAVWLTDTIWLVKDRFELSSNRVLDRTMFCQLVTSDRIHVTADDMPGGADIELHDRGFRFTPYDVLVDQRGLTLRLRCHDEDTLDEHGFIHDLVTMYVRGVRVATIRSGPITREAERASTAPHPTPGADETRRG